VTRSVCPLHSNHGFEFFTFLLHNCRSGRSRSYLPSQNQLSACLNLIRHKNTPPPTLLLLWPFPAFPCFQMRQFLCALICAYQNMDLRHICRMNSSQTRPFLSIRYSFDSPDNPKSIWTKVLDLQLSALHRPMNPSALSRPNTVGGSGNYILIAKLLSPVEGAFGQFRPETSNTCRTSVFLLNHA